MFDRHPQGTTDTTTGRAACRLRLGVALAMACLPGAAFAQTPAKTATAAPKAARPGAQVAPKPGAAKNARARRVAPATPKPVAPAPAAAVAVPTPKVEVKSEVETEAGSKSPARPEPESPSQLEDAAKSGEPAGGAAKVAASGGASGVELEPSDLRMQIKGARPEDRGRLQRALTDRLVALDRKAEALDELRLMIHEDRYDPAFFFNTGNALARLGDANAAADAYRKAVSQRRGNYARALNNLGVVLTRQGRWDEAHEVLVSALTQENFTYAEASYNLGRLHLLRGQTDLALREWSRTLRLQPDHAEAAAALARAYAEDGDTGRALAVLESFTARVARAGGGVPREIAYARTAIVESRERAGDGGDAKDSGAGVGMRYPPAAVGATASAATFPARSASRPGPARASAAPRSVTVDRATYAALETARAASERGRHEEAARHYRTVLSRNGGYLPPANLELSFALIALNRQAEAAAALQTLVERDGARYPVAHYHLARIHERAGQTALAADHFARAAALYGDANPQVLLDLSRTREKLGDTRGALEAVESYAETIARQGSVPHWVVERADALRMKARTEAKKQ